MAVDYKELKKGGFMRQRQKDHFSMRLKSVGGHFTAAQLGTVQKVAEQYGKGYVHLTSRQGIEIPFIRIEDIATRSEMEKARFYRVKQGKHIIPVPTIELKPHFSGYLIDPLQSFFKRSSTRRRRLGEKSIVRPVFSYYGKLVIDDSAIKGIVRHVILNEGPFSKVSDIEVKHLFAGDEDQGLRISCNVVLTYGNHIPTLLKQAQEKVTSHVEFMTGMIVHEVDIVVKTLYVRA